MGQTISKYGIDGLKVRYPKYDYDGNFKLNVLNWRKDISFLSETALQFDISNPGTIATWQRKLILKVLTPYLLEEDGLNT